MRCLERSRARRCRRCIGVGEAVHSLQLPGLVEPESQQVLGEFGNMSSPTVLFILERLRQRQAPTPCVALAFGPGLTIEAALIR